MAIQWRQIPRQTVSAGQTFTLELTQYIIDRGTAIPTVSIQPQNGSASIDSSNVGTTGDIFLAWTLPPTTNEGNDSLQLSITRDGRTVTRYVTAAVQAASAPTWQVIPTQEVNAGQEWSLELSPTYLSGEPTPTVSFQTGFFEPTWLHINGTTLSGTPNLSDYSPGDTAQINLRASNTAGNANIRFNINYVVQLEGQSGFSGEPWSFDVASHIPHGDTVALRPGYQKPAWLTLTGTTLSAVALPAVAIAEHDDDYQILLRGTRGAQTYDFNVPLRVRYATAPMFRDIPVQVLDEPVGPNIVPNPPLVTSKTLDLRDYLTARSGSTFAFTVITKPDWVTISDSVLTMTAPAVVTAPAGQAYQQFEVNVAVRSAFGRTATTVNIHVNELALPHIARIPPQTVYRDEIDTIDLTQYGTGTPAPFYTLGTINPPLTADVATIISNSNGQWSVHPNTALSADSTHNVQVYVRNRVGQSFILMQLNLKGEDHPLPALAPVWKSGADTTFTLNTGTSQTINLLHLLSQARPTPTFEMLDATDFTDLDGTATLNGHLLTVSAPDVDTDITRFVRVTARNSAGAVQVELTFNVKYVVLPVWRALPAQRWQVGVAQSFDLKPYLSATPAATISFASGYTAPSWLTLTDGDIGGTPPTDDYSEATSLSIQVSATNPAGTSSTAILANILVPSLPIWTADTIYLDVVERADASWDLTEYLTGGFPIPTLRLAAGVVQPRLTLGVTGTVLSIVNAPEVSVDTDFTITLEAVNTAGMVSKEVNLTVYSQLSLTEENRFSLSDYDEIRGLLNLQLTETDISNSQIARDVYERAALDWASDSLPPVANGERTAVNLRHKKRAAIYRCAGILAGSAPQLLRESLGGINSQYERVAWNDKQLTLFRLAEDEITTVRKFEQAVASDRLASSFTFFAVVKRQGG